MAIFILIVYKQWVEIKYPLGLSYVIFQVISYLIDVYKTRQVEKDLKYFSFYLLLFPKMPVGPITRFGQLRDQIHDPHQVEPCLMADGARRFLVGLAKKTLLADTLARVVTPIFAMSSPVISPAMAWLVIISYSLQIFFDFSGYIDMAMGVGQMMGIRFIENFNLPYLSKNFGEFWRRWHISLSNWFRDYVFYPLERQRIIWIGQPVNILFVFLLTGIWHGISINFLIWGLIHGLALVFEATKLGRKLRTAWAPLQHIYFLGILLVSWVFFRSPTLHFAMEFISRLLGNTQGVTPLPFEVTSPLPFIEPTFMIALFVGVVFVLPIEKWINGLFERIPSDRTFARSAAQGIGDLLLVSIYLLSIAAIASSTFTPNIYGAF